jgi:multicomponent Na+:H+ antiporter subunit G
MMQHVGEALVLLGALLTLLAAIGVARFQDAFARMHALSKATTAGVLVALLGAAVTMPTANDATSMIFAAVLQVVTNPVSSVMLARAAYHAEGVPIAIHATDELARDLEP